MICNKCNHRLPDDSEFCQYCGSKLDKADDNVMQQCVSAETHEAMFEQKTSPVDIVQVDSNNIFTENANNLSIKTLQQNKVISAKFCYACGTKSVDGASFCSECGTSLQGNAIQNNLSSTNSNMRPTSNFNTNKRSNNSKALTIINFAFYTCLTIYACLAFLAVALHRVSVRVTHNVKLSTNIAGQKVISSNSPSALGHVYLNEGAIIFATVFAVAILTLGIISFIFGLKKRDKNNITELFSSILRLVISASVTAITIVLLCDY